MSMKRNLLFLLATTATVSALQPANANDCITRRTTFITPGDEVRVVPQSFVIPTTSTYIQPTTSTYMQPQTIKTTKTTVTTTTPSIIQPTVIETPETMNRSVIMMGATPPAASTSVVTASEVGPFPVYSNRLSAMNEQIDRSLANGWITGYQADNLRLESNRLSQMIMNRDGYLSDTSVLEKGLTGLNLSIQNALQSNGHTAAVIRSTTY